jgi:hypothetical protein
MRFDKHALILAVVEGLRQQGNWTGKTHVQNTLFLLDASGLLKTPFNFVFYDAGPYPLDFIPEFEQMKSYLALTFDATDSRYGVKLLPGAKAWEVKQRAPLSPEAQEAIETICRFVGRKNVAELGPLALAVWIRTREGIQDPAAVVARLREYKSYVSMDAAEEADRQARELLESTRCAAQMVNT